MTCVIPNCNQQDATSLDLFISTEAVHVAGGFSAHRQEHITVPTPSGIVNQYCCLLLSWMRWNAVPSHSLSLDCPTVLGFSTLSHKRQDFGNKILNVKCVFSFSVQILYETLFLIRRRIQRDVIKMCIGIHVKCPLFLTYFNEP